jgi:replication initiator protein
MERASDILKQTHVARLIEEALALEAEEAQAAGALGFMARALVQATMPHRRPETAEFVRRNGAFTLTIMAPSEVGLPYGSIPRLLLAWLTTEAVRTRSRELVLGDSLSEFMRQLGMVPTGGRWGSITRLRAQSHRLFASSVSCLYRGDAREVAEAGFRIADRHVLWWDPKTPRQTELFGSSVVLSEPFFREVTARPVPIDLRALRSLSKSPMQLDIYAWLTYRLSYLRGETTIPWMVLQHQFGSEYHRLRDFKAAFLEHLKTVLTVYRDAKAEPAEGGLLLRPSPPHVRRLSR